MIRLEGVTKLFGGVTAVDNITLSVRPGEIFGLVGPDGAGKTTTIRMLTGIMEASAGKISVLGRENLEENKADIGYVPQKFSLYGDLTVMENILLIGALYGAARRSVEQRAEEILAFTNLLSFRDRLADNLSGGMKQKLALAAGLMHRPQIYFLDEPTAGVDPVSRREFWQLLYHLNKEGMTAFVSTSYMDEAELCSRIAFMHNGKIVACHTPSGLKEAYPHHVLELSMCGREIKKQLAGCSIMGINAFGDKYHLVVDDPQRTIPMITAALEQAGSGPVALKEIPPTLEDVFVALAGEV
jgi:ABC-2 type transport system ATP-binding protein